MNIVAELKFINRWDTQFKNEIFAYSLDKLVNCNLELLGIFIRLRPLVSVCFWNGNIRKGSDLVRFDSDNKVLRDNAEKSS